MINLKLCLSILISTLICNITALPSRAFTNPLNNKRVDVFFLVDESRALMNQLELGLVKTSLNTIAKELNPDFSVPYFGVYFYGSSSVIGTAVPFPTNTSNEFTTKLNAKPYTNLQANPSTLTMALNLVSSDCNLRCRKDVPRVTVIISAKLNREDEMTIRAFEANQHMTVIVIPLGNLNNNSVIGHQLATHPEDVFALPLPDYFQLPVSAQHIASVISDVARLLEKNDVVYISTALRDMYHTIQVNTAPFTTKTEAIVMFATSCTGCAVYASLSELLPTKDNSIQNTDRHEFFTYSGYPNSLYYFRVPVGAGRLFVSFKGNGALAVYATVDVLPLPPTMQHSEQAGINSGLGSLIG